jgi:hypothetical protein
MAEVAVTCTPTAEGWECDVAVDDARATTRHRVAVQRSDLERLDSGAASPDDLVRRSFEFLLEREPATSILRSFDLPTIGRYFPEYEAKIRLDRAT